MYLEQNLARTRQEIRNIKRSVIGLFKIPYPNIRNHFELVVKDNGSTIDSVRFTQFGAIQETHSIPKRKGIYKDFPEGKNMEEMLNDPYEWDKFLNSF